MPTAAADLIVTDLRKEYPTPTTPLVVLRGVNLTLSPGERLAIVGPSGSGKSTLLNILGTLDTPSGGSVRRGGVDPFSLDAKALAGFRSRSIGFIFQDHHLLPQCTALENVLLPRLALGSATTEDDRRRAVELLGQVGLADRVTHLPAELSGGERQRVAIAGAGEFAGRAALRRADGEPGFEDGGYRGGPAAVADARDDPDRRDAQRAFGGAVRAGDADAGRGVES